MDAARNGTRYMSGCMIRTPLIMQNVRHGTSIAAYHWPHDKPRAVVHINHGLAEHAQRYEGFAQSLHQAGFAVYAHDHRGHGATTAPDAPQGIFSMTHDGVERVLADISVVHGHIRTKQGQLPLIMFGHSMGGLITMNYALQNPNSLTGAAVWNSNFSAGLLGRVAQGILRYERFRLGSDVPSHIMPKLTFQDWAKKTPNATTPFDWLSHIPAEVQAYINDPLCGWDASVSLWDDIFKLIFSGGATSDASAAAKSLPFHLLGGGQDPATDNGKAVEKHAANMIAAGFTAVEKTIYPDARHETLNDRDAALATDTLITWINRFL